MFRFLCLLLEPLDLTPSKRSSQLPEDDGEDGMEGVEKKDDEESAVCAAAG